MSFRLQPKVSLRNVQALSENNHRKFQAAIRVLLLNAESYVPVPVEDLESRSSDSKYVDDVDYSSDSDSESTVSEDEHTHDRDTEMMDETSIDETEDTVTDLTDKADTMNLDSTNEFSSESEEVNRDDFFSSDSEPEDDFADTGSQSDGYTDETIRQALLQSSSDIRLRAGNEVFDAPLHYLPCGVVARRSNMLVDKEPELMMLGSGTITISCDK